MFEPNLNESEGENSKMPPISVPALKVATWNVNSIAARLPLALRWLEETATKNARPDILCLQEIKCVDAKFPTEAFAAAGYQSYLFGQPTYNGVAILVREELAGEVSGEIQKNLPSDAEDAQRRLISVNVAGLQVVNVYIPNGQAVGTEKYAFKLDWLERLKDYFDSNCDAAQPVLLCGDFNIATSPLDLYSVTEWEGKNLYSEPEKQALEKIRQWGFNDAFRQLYPDKAEAFSWWDYRQAAFRRNLGLRIDHIWITDSLKPNLCEVVIDTEPRKWERPSDHTPVIASFEF